MAEKENTQDWLSIARSFKPSASGDGSATPSNERPAAPVISAEDNEINEINEKRLVTGTEQTLTAQVGEYIDETEAIARALGVTIDAPGDYDRKATIAGGIPPLEAVLARQEWLSKIDWRFGLRCGIDAHQCQTCKGDPCRGTTEWPHGESND